jgi:ferredoxin
MYVILTTKPGVFTTKLSDGLTSIEVYDYVLFGKKKAQFTIARIEGEPRITIVEDEPPHVTNHIPSKFLQKYQSVDTALQEIRHLAKFASMDARLEKVAASAPQLVETATGVLKITFITNGNKQAVAPVNSNLLRASLREQGGIPFKCGGGVCGTCKCKIEKGIENTDEVKPKERKHLSPEDFKAGYRMACQTFLKGDVSVSWEPRRVSAAPPAARSSDPV